VATPADLSWEPVVEARSYEVSIHTATGGLVWREQMSGPPAVLPAAVRRSLEPGQSYFWDVQALLSQGERAESELTRFTVRE